MDFKDKSVLIINGDSGLGYEISAMFARGGANLTISYNRNSRMVSKYVRKIKTEEQAILCYDNLVNNYSSVKGLIRYVESRFHGVDILIFIARPKKLNSLESIDIDRWRDDIYDDLTLLYYCTKEISKIMVSRKAGKIIPVFFGVGARGDGNMLSWSASTGGITGFIKCLAMEFLRYRINVNGVAYGLIDEVAFPFMARRVLKQYLQVLRVPRTGKARDIVNAVRFLASNESDYITGHILYVNGGLLM